MNGSVLIYSVHRNEPEHERVCHIDIGRRLSLILGRPFGGYHNGAQHLTGEPPYLIATDTIIGTKHANALGINDESRLFGGVAPHYFMSTKAITHPLRHPDATAPEGWSHEFPDYVRHVVLKGYTVFSHDDAIQAGHQLLRGGPVRLKPVQAKAGRGQLIVKDELTLEAALLNIDPTALAASGLVLEEHLDHVSTYSVGQVRVAGLVASYVGTQRLTIDNKGEEVYGGSELLVTRGDYPALFLLPLPSEMMLAIAQAQLYDRAASLSYPEFFASRRNYDIAYGTDIRGRMRCGVLEQSWRPGGASAAEILALEALHARPDLKTIQAATLETFGDHEDIPAQAIELFNGKDRDVGHIRKYVMLKRYGNP